MRARVQALGLAHAASPTAPSVTVSIGLVWIEPGQSLALDAALRAADAALYAAKQSGRNRVCLGSLAAP